MSIAVIPARGGSKRIPRKNIKLFNGLPVIAYAIKAAKESGIFSEVFVSTEDEEIAEIAKSFGATIPWMRPKDLSEDDSTTISVMQDAVIKLKSCINKLEYVCCVYPATPLLQPKFIQEGLKVIMDGNWDYTLSASRVETPPKRFFSLDSANNVQMHFPENEETRTQDFLPTYRDAGQFYFGRSSSWELGLGILSSRSTIIEIPHQLSVDIDTLSDWHYAERLFAMNMGELSEQ
jgi:pseudaminic acid cytidylyltransferase